MTGAEVPLLDHVEDPPGGARPRSKGVEGFPPPSLGTSAACLQAYSADGSWGVIY